MLAIWLSWFVYVGSDNVTDDQTKVTGVLENATGYKSQDFFRRCGRQVKSCKEEFDILYLLGFCFGPDPDSLLAAFGIESGCLA